MVVIIEVVSSKLFQGVSIVFLKYVAYNPFLIDLRIQLVVLLYFILALLYFKVVFLVDPKEDGCYRLVSLFIFGEELLAAIQLIFVTFVRIQVP